MAATSLIKFMNQTNGNGRGNVQWGRADRDGAPLRSQTPLTMTEEEAEERLVKVADPHNQLFDLSDADQNTQYLEVLDKITNGWAQLLAPREVLKCKVRRKLPDGTIELDVRIKIYLEWAEYFMEDGTPMHSQRPYIGRPNDGD